MLAVGKTSGPGFPERGIWNKYDMWVLFGLLFSRRIRQNNSQLDTSWRPPSSWCCCPSWCWFAQDFRNRTSGTGSGTSMACGYSLVFFFHGEQDETIPNLIRRHGGLLDLAAAHPDVGWHQTSGPGRPGLDIRNKYGMRVLSGLCFSRRTRWNHSQLDTTSWRVRCHGIFHELVRCRYFKRN